MKKLLIVIDMQKDFTTGPLGNAECAAAIGPVVREITSGRYDKIYVTYDTHHENYMETREGRFLPVPHCIEGSEGWQLDDEVEAALASVSGENGPEADAALVSVDSGNGPEAALVSAGSGNGSEVEAALASVSSGNCDAAQSSERPACSAGCEIVRIKKPTFGSTALQAAVVNDLANAPDGIEVTLVGVCTGICVISNAMLIKAACPEIDIRVIADACACVSPETHRTALEAMKLCQIEVN